MIATAIALLIAAASPQAPIVIAHRGASGERPEHTLAAYELAIDQGADFIEPDLVITRDGILVARHENEISETTDVASRPEFTARKTSKTIDGRSIAGWFTEDFTLAELKALRARERLPQLRAANTRYDGQFEVPTLAEVIALVQRKQRETGRIIGLYPETKHPSYFRSIGLPLEEPLVAALDDAGYRGAQAAVFIQSFEVNNLKRLHGMTDVRLIQLVASEFGPPDVPGLSYADMVKPEGLAAVARYARGIGAEKPLVIPRDASGTLGKPSMLVSDAHAAGLQVHIWTFRRENYFLPPTFRVGEMPQATGDLGGEIRAFLAAGVDGVFTDNVAEGVAAAR